MENEDAFCPFFCEDKDKKGNTLCKRCIFYDDVEGECTHEGIREVDKERFEGFSLVRKKKPQEVK